MNGKMGKIIHKKYDRIKMSEKDVLYFLSKKYFNTPYSGMMSKEIKDDIIKEYKFPELKPAIQKLFIDDEDRLWILTYEKNVEGFYGIDLFDSDGIYLQRLWLRNYPVLVKDNHIYFIYNSDLKMQQLIKKTNL